MTLDASATAPAAPAIPAPAGATVWVAVIDHDHGSDATVSATKEGAFAAIVAFADQWWDQEISGGFDEDRERPERDEDMVAEYFEHVQGESYTLTEAVVTA